MSTPSNPLGDGHYARKQLYCPSRVVAWSHGSRFRLALQLALEKRAGLGRHGPGEAGTLLDYGCGDGTFVAMVREHFRATVGADVDVGQIVDCRRRFGSLPDVTFVATATLDADSHSHAYDVVTCMEVLEHCADAERIRVLDALGHCVRAGGRIIVSVPIEIGPALVGKQFFRALAAWRGHGDYRYRETYTPREMMRAVLARPPLARAVYTVDGPAGAQTYCGHKGFDWRQLEREVRARFTVERRMFSPLPLLGPVLNSQVWFVCRA